MEVSTKGKGAETPQPFKTLSGTGLIVPFLILVLKDTPMKDLSFAIILIAFVLLIIWLAIETPLGGLGSTCAIFLAVAVYGMVAEIHPSNREDK